MKMDSRGKKIFSSQQSAFSIQHSALSIQRSAENIKFAIPDYFRKSKRLKTMILITEIETPIGKMTACAVEAGVCLLEFSDREGLSLDIETLARRWKNPQIAHLENLPQITQQVNDPQSANLANYPQVAHMANLQRQLDEYFHGALKDFRIPVVLTGTEFQQKTWQALQTIPYGTTITYKEQAASLNMPDSIRAIANANALNNCLIIVPCHRVIGTSGSLTGYKGELWRKRFLLDLERKHTGIEKGQQVIDFGESAVSIQ